MFLHISIVFKYSPPMKRLSYFSLVDTAMRLKTFTLSGKGIISCLVFLKLRYSKLYLSYLWRKMTFLH